MSYRVVELAWTFLSLFILKTAYWPVGAFDRMSSTVFLMSNGRKMEAENN
jgi:hypothetical protein